MAWWAAETLVRAAFGLERLPRKVAVSHAPMWLARAFLCPGLTENCVVHGLSTGLSTALGESRG